MSSVNILMYTLILEVILPNIFYICGILAKMTYFHYNILRILHYASAFAKIKLCNLLFQNESCKKLIVLNYFQKIWLSYSKSRLLINLPKKGLLLFYWNYLINTYNSYLDHYIYFIFQSLEGSVLS